MRLQGLYLSPKLMSIAALALVCSAASAEPIRWTFNDAVFSDGGKLRGSFVYDVDTGVVSDVHVKLTKGLGFLAPNLDPVGPNSFFVTGEDLSPNFGPPGTHITLLDSLNYSEQINWLAIIPTTPLTDAGGQVALTTDTNVADPYPTLSPHGELHMDLTDGSLIGRPVPVPEPSEVAVLLAGLVAIGWRMRRPTSG